LCLGIAQSDDIAAASPTTNIAFALGPDDVKVEFVEDKLQKGPIQLHHIHFFGQMNTEMQAWYAKTQRDPPRTQRLPASGVTMAP
jgi:hypothetical protein